MKVTPVPCDTCPVLLEFPFFKCQFSDRGERPHGDHIAAATHPRTDADGVKVPPPPVVDEMGGESMRCIAFDSVRPSIH